MGAESGRRFVTTRVEVEGREETKVVELPDRESEPWGTDATLRVAGTGVPRGDALEKVTGSARYTADVRRPGMLHAAILRAPIAHGRVVLLDLLPALSIAGVRDAIARADVPEIDVGGITLFDPQIQYAGQPVAAVCAETPELADRALRAIRIAYEALPHAVTATAALAPGAPRVRGEANRTNDSPRIESRGDLARGLAEAEVVIRREYRVPVALHTALEPHGTVAEWTGDAVTVWESTQGVFMLRDDIATAFGIPKARVRVLMDYMGGGFGAKNGAGPQTYIAVALARRLGVSVRCVLDRQSEQMDTGNRPASIQRVILGARRDGRLTAIGLEAVIPLGIGGWEGGPGKFYHQMYSCPNVRTEETFAYIHASAMSSFRAPGHAEGAFGLERAMDVLARELGIDPLALRLENYAARDEEKGRSYTSKRLDECYRIGADRFGWNARRHPDQARAEDRRVRRGFGMASQVWGGGGGPPAYAIVKIHSDGSIDVLTGCQDLGTGARTVLAQIAAEALGTRFEDVRVVVGDTERTPYAGNSWGSMTTASVGPAVRLAAEDARETLLDAASEMLSVPAERLEIGDGVIAVPDESRSVTIAEVATRLGDVMIIGRGNRGPNPTQMSIQTFGAQFAEVEVELDTGRVRVVRLVAVHDVGRVVNPMLAESQLHGGIIQGIGYALFEERILDERLGVPLNPNMHDYKIPTHADVPAIDALFVGSADPAANPIGAKGVGEPPIIPTAPAIANAVADAIGRDVSELPLTPWRVLNAIGKEQ